MPPPSALRSVKGKASDMACIDINAIMTDAAFQVALEAMIELGQVSCPAGGCRWCGKE